jgi:hypothetical protein
MISKFAAAGFAGASELSSRMTLIERVFGRAAFSGASRSHQRAFVDFVCPKHFFSLCERNRRGQCAGQQSQNPDVSHVTTP